MTIDNYAVCRSHMITGQLMTNDVIDPRILAAIRETPREAFLPESLKHVAYVDEDLPLGQGRYVMEPLVFARLLDASAVQETDKVLDIGVGMGYSTAVLARLTRQVTGLEENEELWQKAQMNVTSQLIRNADVVKGQLAYGYARSAPYDVIVLQGACEIMPEAILDQLSDGGRLLAVMRRGKAPGQLWRYQRVGETIAKTELFDAQVPHLPGFQQPETFRF